MNHPIMADESKWIHVSRWICTFQPETSQVQLDLAKSVAELAGRDVVCAGLPEAEGKVSLWSAAACEAAPVQWRAMRGWH